MKQLQKSLKKTALLPFFQFGSIINPWQTLNPSYPDSGGGGLIVLLNNILKTATVVGGIYAFINIILAGYEFMSASGNSEKITAATAKIWQSLIGLLVIAGSYILAGIVGWLIFGNFTAITNPVIYGPN